MMDWSRCTHLDLLMIPALIAPSITCTLVAMTSTNWLEFYRGHLMVSHISPWKLCSMSCIQCTNYVHELSCFWMKDWGSTRFPNLTAVKHLEYFSLGPILLAFVMGVLTFVDRRRKYCLVDLRKPIIILLALSGLLSIIAIILFGHDASRGWIEIQDLDHFTRVFAWPFYCRVLGAIFAVAATIAAMTSVFCVKPRLDLPDEEEAMFITMPTDELLANTDDGMDV